MIASLSRRLGPKDGRARIETRALAARPSPWDGRLSRCDEPIGIRMSGAKVGRRGGEAGCCRASPRDRGDRRQPRPHRRTYGWM